MKPFSLRWGLFGGFVLVSGLLSSSFADIYYEGEADAGALYPNHGSNILQDFELVGTTPGKWGNPTFGTPATISWSLHLGSETFDETPFGAGTGSIVTLASVMPVGYKAEIERAFDAWSAIAGLIFMEVPDGGANFNTSTTSGHLRLGGHIFDGANSVLAHALPPPDFASNISGAGDVHFDAAENWAINALEGATFTKDIFQIAAHEIGHAIGLGHTAVAGSLMLANYSEGFSGPQLDDIAGAQFLYGSSVVVPEPSSLFAFGLIGLVLYGRRFKAVRQKLRR